MDFSTAVKTCLNKYATFSGRAQRSEYWWFYLFVLIVATVLSVVDIAIFNMPDTSPLASIFTLAILLPILGAGVRRLHDLDKSGWWILIGLVPLIGFIVLIVWFASKGTDGDNRFGSDPLAG